MDNISTFRNFHVFNEFNPELLPPNEKKLFEENGVIINFKKNDFIYKADTNPRGAYLLISGLVKVNQINSEGKEQILFFFSVGELY